MMCGSMQVFLVFLLLGVVDLRGQCYGNNVEVNGFFLIFVIDIVVDESGEFS